MLAGLMPRGFPQNSPPLTVPDPSTQVAGNPLCSNGPGKEPSYQSASVTGAILANGTVPFTADESMGSHKLTNVNDPTNPQDAATKNYVDSNGGLLPPQTASQFLDDLHYVPSTTSTPFQSLVSGAAAAVAAAVAADTSAPGFWTANYGTSAAGYAGIRQGSGTANICTGGGAITFQARFYSPGNLSDGSNRYEIEVGLQTKMFDGTDATNAIGVRYMDTINGGKFQYYCRQGGSETAADSGLALAANTWYTIKAVVNAAGTLVTFTINAANSQTINTNVPTGTSQPLQMVGSIACALGASARQIGLDYMYLSFTPTGGR